MKAAIQEERAVFVGVQKDETDGTTTEDIFEITYNPSLRQCHANWTEIYKPQNGAPQTDQENGIGITFELIP